MKKNIETFTESLDLEVREPEEEKLYSRRINTYSVAAIKAAREVDRIYVNYPAFMNAVRAMERIFQLAPELEMPQGLILTGVTGAGKTAAFKYFRDTLPSSSLFAPGQGAIGFRCPERPSVGQFVAWYLKATKYPFSGGNAKQLYARRWLVPEGLKDKGTRLIFVDEAPGILLTKKSESEADKESDLGSFLRELVDSCKVGLVLAGSRELEAIGKLNKALASRLPVMERLEPFVLDENWIGFVRAFVKQCKSFDIQYFASIDAARRVHMLTNGNLRDLKRIFTECILIAHDSGSSSIDDSIVNKALPLIFGSSSPRSHV